MQHEFHRDEHAEAARQQDASAVAVIVILLDIALICGQIVCMATNCWVERRFFLPGDIGFGFKCYGGILTAHWNFPFCPTRYVGTSAAPVTEWTTKEKMLGVLRRWCMHMERERGYIGLKDAFCDDKIQNYFFPVGCSAVAAIRLGGIALFFALTISLAASITSVSLMGYYWLSSPKASYFRLARALHAIAPMWNLVALVAYACLPAATFDHMMDSRVTPGMVARKEQVFGPVSWSWAWCAAISFMQFIVPAIMGLARNKHDRDAERLKQMMELEMAVASASAQIDAVQAAYYDPRAVQTWQPAYG